MNDRKLTIGYKNIVRLTTIVYFCSTPIVAVLAKVVGNSIADVLVNITLFLLYAICAILHPKIRRPLKVLILYIIVSSVIAGSMIVHPEYSDWYFHEFYGLTKQFFNLRSGIWAALLISLHDDDVELLQTMKYVILITFIAYSFKFVSAMRRGYWSITNLDGEDTHATYDMEFGYKILFCAAFWGACSQFLNKKYILLYLISSVMIMLGGSRGSFVWTIAVYLVTIPFHIKRLTQKKKRIVAISLIFLLPLLCVAVLNVQSLLQILGTILKKLGVSSRNATSLIDGSISSSRGRSIIYQMAIELIGTGGLFGRGFYGDRYYIGRRFRWGYSHDIFLELLVTFGILGGTLVIVALIVGIRHLYRKADSNVRKTIFITFLVSSFKLILSSSFWYEPSFWSLIALMLVWNHRSIPVPDCRAWRLSQAQPNR